MSHNYKGAVTPHCLVVLFPEIEFSGYKKKLTAESSFHLHKIWIVSNILFRDFLSFIKVFEVFRDFLFHLAGVMYIPYPPDSERREAIHPQKRGRIPMRFDLFIYSAKLKFLFRSLFNRFFNALAGSTFFHALDS